MKLPKKRWLISIPLVLVVGSLIVYSIFHEESVKVQIDKVMQKSITQSVSAPGKIQPVEEVDISAYVSAEITRLFVTEGEEVKKDQLLAELDSTRYKATLDQVRATLLSAKSQVRMAEAKVYQSERNLKRIDQLYKKNLVGKQELEDTQTLHEINQAGLAASKDDIKKANAALRSARDDVVKTTLSSPIDGKISRLSKEVGEIVMGSQLTKDVIMTVADLSAMEVVAEVDENDVVDIEVGDKTEIEIDAFPDNKFEGQVTEIAISPKIKNLGSQEETTNFEVTVLLTGDVSFLRPGMNATANIIVESRENVLTLPIQCVTMRDVETERKKASGEEISQFRKPGKDALKEVVYQFEDSTVKMVEVTTGISSDTEIELTDGLQLDQEVVCGPYKVLHKDLTDGQTVEVGTEEKEDEKK